MNNEPSRKSHAIAWTLPVIAVPVLYVLTLPPIGFLATAHFASSEKVMESWNGYIVPYNWLEAQTPLQRPLGAYMKFWRERFGYRPHHPRIIEF